MFSRRAGARRYWCQHVWREGRFERKLAEVDALVAFALSIVEQHFRDFPLIVELCCGTGGFTVEFLRRLEGFSKYVCVDTNSDALVELKVNLRKQFVDARQVETKLAYLFDEALGESGSVDLVVCSRAIHHMPDLDEFFSGIEELLHHDGLFIGDIILFESNKSVLQRQFSALSPIVRLVSWLARWLAEKDLLVATLTRLGMLRTYNPKEDKLRRSIERSGLTVVCQDDSVDNGYFRFAAAHSSRDSVYGCQSLLSPKSREVSAREPGSA